MEGIDNISQGAVFVDVVIATALNCYLLYQCFLLRDIVHEARSTISPLTDVREEDRKLGILIGAATFTG